MRSHILDIYGTELNLVTRPREWKQLAKTYRPLSAYTPHAETAGQVSYFTRQPKDRLARVVIVIYIDVRRHHNTGELVDTVAHEASHAAGRILEHASHEVPATDEPHAYLCGWLTRWIYEGCTDGTQGLQPA